MGKSDQERLDAFKRDLYQDIANRKRLFEAETGLAIKDVELVFVDVSTVDQVNQYILNEINVTLGDSDDMQLMWTAPSMDERTIWAIKRKNAVVYRATYF